MVFSKKKGAAAGLASGLLLLGALVSPANAGLIFEGSSDIRPWMFNSPPAEIGWGGVFEDGDGRLLRSAGDVATVLGIIWFGRWLWGDNHAPAIDPPDPRDHPGGDGDTVPEASTLALVGMGALYLLALRKRQK